MAARNDPSGTAIAVQSAEESVAVAVVAVDVIARRVRRLQADRLTDNEGNGLSRALPNVLRGRLPRGELGILVLATLQTPAPPGCASVGEPGPPASQFYC